MVGDDHVQPSGLKNIFEVLPDWKFNKLEELLPKN